MLVVGDEDRSRVLRWLTGLLALCCLVQALLLPAQRSAERPHFHRVEAIGLLAAARHHDAPRRFDGVAFFSGASPVFRHRDDMRHDHDRGHHDAHGNEHAGPVHAHPQLAVHEHPEPADARDAIFVDPPAKESPSGPAQAFKRLLLDLDGVGSASLTIVAVRQEKAVFAEAPLIYRSHLELPPERPPRAWG